MDNLQISEDLFSKVKYFVSGNLNENLEELLERGGAQSRSYISELVTHIICAKSFGEDQITMATDLYNVKPVTERWVTDSVRLKRLANERSYNPLTNNLFQNMNVNIINVDIEDKKKLYSMITFHGGTVFRHLTQQSTHLITGSANGYIYEKARMNQFLKIVTPDWVIDSIQCNKIVDKDLYHPRLMKHFSDVKQENIISGAVNNNNLTNILDYDSLQICADKKNKSCASTSSMIAISSNLTTTTAAPTSSIVQIVKSNLPIQTASGQQMQTSTQHSITSTENTVSAVLSQSSNSQMIRNFPSNVQNTGIVITTLSQPLHQQQQVVFVRPKTIGQQSALPIGQNQSTNQPQQQQQQQIILQKYVTQTSSSPQQTQQQQQQQQQTQQISNTQTCAQQQAQNLQQQNINMQSQSNIIVQQQVNMQKQQLNTQIAQQVQFQTAPQNVSNQVQHQQQPQIQLQISQQNSSTHLQQQQSQIVNNPQMIQQQQHQQHHQVPQQSQIMAGQPASGPINVQLQQRSPKISSANQNLIQQQQLLQQTLHNQKQQLLQQQQLQMQQQIQQQRQINSPQIPPQSPLLNPPQSPLVPPQSPQVPPQSPQIINSPVHPPSSPQPPSTPQPIQHQMQPQQQSPQHQSIASMSPQPQAPTASPNHHQQQQQQPSIAAQIQHNLRQQHQLQQQQLLLQQNSQKMSPQHQQTIQNQINRQQQQLLQQQQQLQQIQQQQINQQLQQSPRLQQSQSPRHQQNQSPRLHHNQSPMLANSTPSPQSNLAIVQPPQSPMQQPLNQQQLSSPSPQMTPPPPPSPQSSISVQHQLRQQIQQGRQQQQIQIRQGVTQIINQSGLPQTSQQQILTFGQQQKMQQVQQQQSQNLQPGQQQQIIPKQILLAKPIDSSDPVQVAQVLNRATPSPSQQHLDQNLILRQQMAQQLKNQQIQQQQHQPTANQSPQQQQIIISQGGNQIIAQRQVINTSTTQGQQIIQSHMLNFQQKQQQQQQQHLLQLQQQNQMQQKPAVGQNFQFTQNVQNTSGGNQPQQVRIINQGGQQIITQQIPQNQLVQQQQPSNNQQILSQQMPQQKMVQQQQNLQQPQISSHQPQLQQSNAGSQTVNKPFQTKLLISQQQFSQLSHQQQQQILNNQQNQNIIFINQSNQQQPQQTQNIQIQQQVINTSGQIQTTQQPQQPMNITNSSGTISNVPGTNQLELDTNTPVTQNPQIQQQQLILNQIQHQANPQSSPQQMQQTNQQHVIINQQIMNPQQRLQYLHQQQQLQIQNSKQTGQHVIIQQQQQQPQQPQQQQQPHHSPQHQVIQQQSQINAQQIIGHPQKSQIILQQQPQSQQQPTQVQIPLQNDQFQQQTNVISQQLTAQNQQNQTILVQQQPNLVGQPPQQQQQVIIQQQQPVNPQQQQWNSQNATQTIIGGPQQQPQFIRPSQWQTTGSPGPQRQLIHLDNKTHAQFLAMDPAKKAEYIAKLQKQRLMLRQPVTYQTRADTPLVGQTRPTAHIIVQSPMPSGLTQQQQMQWLQQQGTRQVLVRSTSTSAPTSVTGAPGLSPLSQQSNSIVQQHPAQPQQTFSIDGGITQTNPQQQQLLLQRQQQIRYQQIQLQREQNQKMQVPNVNITATQNTTDQQQTPNITVNSQHQIIASPSTPQIIQNDLPQNITAPVAPNTVAPGVNTISNVGGTTHQQMASKTKTALANMLNNRAAAMTTTINQSEAMTPTTPNEPSAAGTLRLMTAQHNAALNQSVANSVVPRTPQELIVLQQQQMQQQHQQQQQSHIIQQRRTIGPNGQILTVNNIVSQIPTGVQQIIMPQSQQNIIGPATPTGTTMKGPSYSPVNRQPIPPRPQFYGHNPNLKLPADLFLLGCTFFIVEYDEDDENENENYKNAKCARISRIDMWEDMIEMAGGEVEKAYCQRVTHVLCRTQRHGVVMQAIRDSKRCVTEYWLNDVLLKKQLFPPWQALHLPMPSTFGCRKPATKHVIAFSGFEGDERNLIKSMIYESGAIFTRVMSTLNTVLICRKPEGAKYKKSKEWNIPIVNTAWLSDILLGNLSLTSQYDNPKYQQYNLTGPFRIDYSLVPHLMAAWKSPINLTQDAHERVKRSLSEPISDQKQKKSKICEDIPENVICIEYPNDENIPRILFSQVYNGVGLKKAVNALGGIVVENPTDATHLVVTRLGNRTLKIIQAITFITYACRSDWIIESAKAGKFLSPDNFKLADDEIEKTFEFSFEKTLQSKARKNLFDGKIFYITPSVIPDKKFIENLIINSGGKVEKKRRPLSNIIEANTQSPNSYVIVSVFDDLQFMYGLLRAGNPKCVITTTEGIMTSILRQTICFDENLISINNNNNIFPIANKKKDK